MGQHTFGRVLERRGRANKSETVEQCQETERQVELQEDKVSQEKQSSGSGGT